MTAKEERTRISQNTDTQQSKLNPLMYWLLCHSRAFVYAVGDLIRTPLSSLLTLLVIGVAMALPMGLYILLQNFQTISQHWNDSPTVSLYLKQNTSADHINFLINRIKNNPQVQQVQYISPQQGLAEFENITHLKNILAELNENPVPPVLVITPKSNYESPSQLQSLLNSLQLLPEVDVGQLDMAWVKRLYYIITLGERITYTLALLLGIGVVLIIGNTIRLTTQSHQPEINVLKLVGATPAFIRRPLIYRGLLYGIIGGAIAWLLISSMLWWLEPPAQALAQTYDNQLALHGLSIAYGFSIIGLCSALAFLGSWLAVSRHLRG